jgi:hypothetical protein
MTRDPNGVGLRRLDAVRGLVSVIIPARNAAAWIAETIGSVKAQTYRHVEVVVVDDGSTDGTGSIAANHGALVIEGPGAGPGAARNAGMVVARGEFLQFLDADDLLAPTKVERQMRLLEKTRADVAWEPFHRLVSDGEPNGEFRISAPVRPEIAEDLGASLLTTRGFIQIGALLVRRNRRTDAIWFTPARGAVEDVRYEMALAFAGARFVSSDVGELGLLFRQHSGPRYSHRPLASFAQGCADNATWAQDHWQRNGGLTSARRAALGEAYAFAARQLAALDVIAFEDVAMRGLAVGDEFTNRLPGRVRFLSRLVGYPRAEMIASGWRKLKGAELDAEAGKP